MGIFLLIVFAFISAAFGSSKGYSSVLCFIAGLFTGVIAIIVIALLPNKIEQEEERAFRQEQQRIQEQKIKQLQYQVNEMEALKKRIRELEEAQKTADESAEENC